MAEDTLNEFSSTYRSELAEELLSEPDKDLRRDKLIDAQQTIDYRLARGEKHAIAQGEDFQSYPVYDQNWLHGDAEGSMGRHFYSNEASLYKFIPFIENKKGGIIGVGSDQVLDLFANSETSHAYIVDFTEDVSLMTRTLLEVGSYHKKVFGTYPNPDEFMEYFEFKNLQHISRIIERNLTKDESFQVIDRLYSGIPVYYKTNESTKESYSKYLSFKNNLNDDRGETYSWMSDNKKIAKVLEAYDDNRIKVIKGNIADAAFMERLADDMDYNDVKLSILYWSNAEEYITKDLRSSSQFLSGVEGLPVSEDAVILRTAWDTNAERLKLPKQVKKDEMGKKILYEWHYNIQDLDDWKYKAKTRPDYLGWEIYADMQDYEKKHGVKSAGLSIIGLED